MKKRLRIGIVGCGAIGTSLAREISGTFRKDARLCAVYDIESGKSESLSRILAGGRGLCAGSLDELIRRSEFVIESSSAKSSWGIAVKALSKGRSIMVMSVGGMSDHLDELYFLSARNKAMVYFPSGAVSGIDALKAAGGAGIKKVVLTTRKNPRAFEGVEYVAKRFKLAGLRKDKVIFDGAAGKAVKYFPQNINVAAVLSLAGIGMRRTRVRIIASPSVDRNIHEIEIESKAARIFTRTENVLHPRNPKTSFLAVLSAVATLKQILRPVKIGT